MFKMHKSSTLLIVLFGCCSFNSGVSGTCEEGWTSYNEEKCFKVFIDQFVNADQAALYCINQSSSLLTIKSQQEQVFVTTFLFDDSSIVDGVWLNAKRSASGSFDWTDDGVALDYANWATGSPSDDPAKECLQISSRLSRKSTRAPGDGFWSDVSCLSRKIVVCETPSALTLKEIQVLLFETRRRTLELEINPVPIGFIYVQLPKQPTPDSLWPSVTWEQVTSDYAGQFFRAEGENSEPFETTQSENSPRLTSIKSEASDASFPVNSDVEVGKFSSTVRTSLYKADGVFDFELGLSFLVDYVDTLKPEIRPVNTAVRIWKRSA